MRPTALLALLAFIPLAAAAAEQPFLFDALRQPSYRAAWEKLMKDVQPTPDWLAQFNRNFDGMAGQMRETTIEGRLYRLAFVCKPADCAARKFEVLFDADGQHAFGALGGKSDSPAFYGAPPPPLREALAAAIKG